MRRTLTFFASAVIAGSAFAQAGGTEMTRVIVAYKPGTVQQIRQAVASARGSVALEIHGMDAMAVNVPSQAIRGLARNPNVAYVEEDVKRYPFGTGWTPSAAPYQSGQKVPYGIKMVQADQLSDGSAGTRTVCIIDSGYQLSHEDLAQNNVNGTNVSGTGLWSTDESGHGTHVAGTIAAMNNSGVGVVGVAPNKALKLHIIKVFGADGWAYTSTLTSAAQLCKTAGANIISMSLGGSFKSRTEETAFASLLSGGILPIAAAGNGGNSTTSYPAGYASVVSVAAVDENEAWATFSQYNKDVEISGPGVNVLSTVPMGSGKESGLTVGATAYQPGGMDGSPVKTATAPLFDFGSGVAVNQNAAGKICLISRGADSFAVLVSNCQASGGVGAVVYNNVAGGFGGTLGTTITNIPSVTASDTEGAAMKGQIGQNATVAVTATNYAFFDGTSMATPHVSAVAALVWSYQTNCSATQVRNALNATAKNLGPAGRDTKFGWGLVQAVAAKNRLTNGKCGA